MGIATDIAEYMAQVENSWQPFKDIDTSFYALDYLEDVIDPDNGYPLAFRTPPEGEAFDKATGVPGARASANKNPIQLEYVSMDICIMIAAYSNNIRYLTKEAERYIGPLRALYYKEYRMGGLVEDTILGHWRMGRWEFHDTSHYGLVVPAVMKFRTQYQIGT